MNDSIEKCVLDFNVAGDLSRSYFIPDTDSVLSIYLCDMCACVLSHFSRIRLCNLTDCSSPGSSVHGILQARILEWVAVSSSRGSSQSRYQSHILMSYWQAGSLLFGPPGNPCVKLGKSVNLLDVSFPICKIREMGRNKRFSNSVCHRSWETL